MKSDLILERKYTELKFRNQPNSFVYKDSFIQDDEKDLPEILFITSYPPRECGIATYSQDLINALNNQYDNSFECSICALESDTEQHFYKDQPKFILNTDQPFSYKKAVDDINKDHRIKLVVIQHEFGFFSTQEKAFKHLFTQIYKPLIFVFHTVLPTPNDELKTNVQEMSTVAESIIVMTENAAEILIKDYNVAATKIKVIPHGTHLIAPLNQKKVREKYNLKNKTVLSTFGLLSSSKNIETTLNALPSVIKTHPEVLFLILGKTHPSIVKHEGEKYREMLKAKVVELELEDHVRFVNEYLQLPILLEYLQLTDIYLFTSKDPNQAVSGTFSYAVSCGCPIISTPIPHAKEVLGNNNGIIFDFENAGQLSAAINSLLDNEALRNEISLNCLHKMASTAWQNSAIAHALLFEELLVNEIKLTYRIPKINLNHIKNMTTYFGIIQFSKISIPDINSGYTLDDNARALIAMCQHYELSKNTNDLGLIYTYLNYVKNCLQMSGLFLNYINKQEEFTAANFQENLEDSNGRAMWALGYVISLKNKLPQNITDEAENLFETALPFLINTHSTRAMAFIIKGLHFQNNFNHRELIQVFASRLVQMYKHEKMEDWHWFENYLTYGNSLLPEALLCAYQSTKHSEYKEIAEESFDFLLSKIFINDTIKVISNKGWYVKDNLIETTLGGEQPIDVAYTIMTLEKFYTEFNKKDYKNKLNSAFNWFLGDNHLNQIVYNPCTGGCYDGVEEFNVNLNQGAESTISYLLARLSIERINQPKVSKYIRTEKNKFELV